jgi:polyhydroxyalkanoate synthesis regulator phasin
MLASWLLQGVATRLEPESVCQEHAVDLEQLIATEQRLDESLRHARAVAAQLVEEAKAAAGQAEAALAADIEAAAEGMAVAAAKEREEREAAIAREAAAGVARADGVSAARVRALAQDLVDRLVVETP